jgi:FkbM family methyltransferase
MRKRSSVLGRCKEFALSLRRPVFESLGSDRYSYLAINDLDRKLSAYMDFRGGTFIEAGANDGLAQNNSYWFERFRGWRGLLIEAVPEKAIACRRNRPKATVVQSALVASDDVKSVRIRTAGLMAYVEGGFTDPAQEKIHLDYAMEFYDPATITEIEVPARTLSSILDEQKMDRIDLLSLDVEGFEAEVLKGLDISRHHPAYILVETKQIDAIMAVLRGAYEHVGLLSHHDYLLRVKVL